MPTFMYIYIEYTKADLIYIVINFIYKVLHIYILYISRILIWICKGLELEMT